MAIRLLSPTLINQIAAGEVVERPAAAVKELVENSLDAQATSIEVYLREGGRSYLSVVDNGLGMTPEDLNLCVERHATSKLQDDDLFHIKTLGFRGEALPSIGSVARLTITTKNANQDHAWSLSVEGGTKQDLMPSSLPCGTKIEVRDLFFATPVRLKFLKSPQTETSHILDVLRPLAMAYPSVSFSVKDDRKVLLHYPAPPSGEETLLNRLAMVLGEDFAANALPIDFSIDSMALTGYAGLPTLNRSNAAHQFFFVNNRPVKDKIFNHAVRLAYEDFLARDRFPTVCCFLTLDPELVDSNVHPTKTEVRFREPGHVRSLLINGLKSALKGGEFRASTTVAQAALQAIQGGVDLSPTPPSVLTPLPGNTAGSSPNPKSHYKPASLWGSTSRPPQKGAQTFALKAQAPYGFRESSALAFPPAPVPSPGEPSSSAPEIAEEPLGSYPLGLARAHVHGTYVIAESEEGLVIVDQHAVHERLVYERLKKQISENNVARQGLLIPEVVDLSEPQQAKLLEFKDDLEEFGLIIEPFGGTSVVIREIPAVLGPCDYTSLLKDIAEDLEEIGTSTKLKLKVEEFLGTFACHTSIRSGRKLSLPEMNELLRQMETTPFSGQCNHGRPTYVELKKKDIERLFGRR